MKKTTVNNNSIQFVKLQTYNKIIGNFQSFYKIM